MELSKREKQIIEEIRNAPTYADIRLVKRPTRNAPDGEIQSVSVEHKKFFGELSTAKTKSDML